MEEYQGLFNQVVRRHLNRHSSAGHPLYEFAFGAGSVAGRLLAAYNLIGNKHVPHAWVCDTMEMRRWLLAGIIDGDGHYSTDKNEYFIPGKQQTVVDGYKLLAATLGLKNSEVTTTTATSADGTVYRGFRVALYGHMYEVSQFCAATYKRCPLPGTSQYVEKQSDPRCYGFHIRKLPVANFHGFAVQGADRRFLLADFTVTHNVSRQRLTSDASD